MTNGIDKRALFKLTTEPYLKPISDLGIGFYNLDENIAYIDFQLKNSKGALQINENNLTAYAYFESSNGSVSDVIKMDIKDPNKGIVSIKLDSEFLQASTDSTVVGQMYIAVNNVKGNPEYNEVAVFQEFKFEVADALINKISAKTKVENIRMFSQLKQRIQTQVEEMEKAIQSGSDYVAEMKSVLQKGQEILNGIVESALTDIQYSTEQTKSDLNRVKNDIVNEVITTADNANSSVQNTASTAVNSITEKAQQASNKIDSSMREFNETVNADGFLTPNKLKTDLEKLQWQKYKLTNDDGSAQTISLSNDVDALHNLEAGIYYFTDTPITESSSTAGFAIVERRGEIVKRIIFQPYNSTQIWLKRFYNTWSDWEQINNIQTDTGWMPLNLVNGVQSYGDTYIPYYKLVNNNGDITLKLKGAVTNITTNDTVIATLPSNIAKLITLTCSFIQNSSIKSGVGTTARWTVSTSGEIKMERASFAVSEMKPTDWYPINTIIPL
ncbi:TPA: BppU family phage baseplate upper protein [Staphylococcus delphini]|nr:BppU family phage baseplate upper protein [Staphylococcus delphini]HEC2177704.1 BppU family phage baseplate upper protein [Staphylococcus delphini]HEC2190296.1 BppU family phage baseplate upper protein [Staphylococcus delphini]HEC2222221.1 BppU family phage baseplate upper protein [Staphylococcus delphini]HEC2226259.1 BppU family phage baseplate upper protein [Staphylococcus delphini]